MRLVPIVLLYTFLAVTGCTGGVGEDRTTANITNPPHHPVSILGQIATGQLLVLLDDYYELKDALVATKAGEADSAAISLFANAEGASVYIRSHDTNSTIILPYLDTIKTELRAMTSMMDEGCEKKRIHFEKISQAMYNMLKKAELKNAGIYHQYCPMAFNDKGAYWLSDREEIRNPYFGDKMLECGEVTDKLN